MTIDWRVTGNAGGNYQSWLRPAGQTALALGAAALALLAAHADLAPGSLDPVATAVDLAVGLAFVGGAALAPGSWRSRSLFAVVGLAWLLGSVIPAAQLAYLAVLLIALATFPGGRLRDSRDQILVGLALVASLVVPPIPVLAALFATVAATARVGRRWERSATWASTVAATALAVVLAMEWLAETTQPLAFDPSLWLLAIELPLLVIAAGFPLASWAVIRERVMLADRLLGDDRVAGLDGLAALLAETLGDPRLRIHRWDAAAGRYVGPDGSVAELGERTPRLTVDDGDERLAVIIHQDTAAMHDPTIVTAIAEAVRLTALNERRQAAQRAQLVELEAARGRLIAATDRQRAVTAVRLRDEVVRPIEEAAAELRRIDDARNGAEAREALAVAGRELDASAGEILQLTGGLPPATLGNGGLVGAIGRLAARCPVPVSVVATPDAIARRERETALFYVCSEALTNAIKHGRPSRISIELHRDHGDLVIVIADDGIGGANLSGFGLSGLADRLAMYDGRLSVDSPPGAGTTVTARIGG